MKKFTILFTILFAILALSGFLASAQINIGRSGKVAATVKTSYVANPSQVLTTTENWRRTVTKTVNYQPTDSGYVYTLSLDTFSTLDKPMIVCLGKTAESAMTSLQDIENLLHEEDASTFEIPINGGTASISVSNKPMQNRFYNALTITSPDYYGEVRMTRDEAQQLVKKFEKYSKSNPE